MGGQGGGEIRGRALKEKGEGIKLGGRWGRGGTVDGGHQVLSCVAMSQN